MKFCNPKMKGESSLAFFCFSEKPVFLNKCIVPLRDCYVTNLWMPHKCMSML